MNDFDKFVNGGGRCITRMNEAQGFGIELLAIDVAADRDE